MLSLRCGTCRYRRIRCDGIKPSCSQCQAVGFSCSGYTASPRASGDRRGVLMRLHPETVPDPLEHGPVYDPVPELYNEAKIIFDGIHYFNERVSGDLISIATHFNPYQVPVSGLDKIPRIYVNLLVTTATVHRTMQDAVSLAPSSVLVQRENDLFAFRLRALQDINHRLDNQETQTSDSTLMCVVCLLLSTMQQSAYGDWRAHLEGARRIIQMRGGVKRLLDDNIYIKPLLALFIAIDVMANTTTSSANKYMYPASKMAVRYCDEEPGILESNLAISMPCPEDLFRCLIMANYLRAISRKAEHNSRRHAGTRMVLRKLESFSPPQWAMKMKSFRGWRPSGDGVLFDSTDPGNSSGSRSSSSSSCTTPGSTHHQNMRPTTSVTSPELKKEVSDSPEPTALIQDLWLNIGIVYHSSIRLYVIRTLIAELSEDKDFLAAEGGLYLDINAIRTEDRRALAECLTPIFSDPINAHQFGKLVYFPMFVCGMETDLKDKDFQDFVAHGLETVGVACGTLGPISAAAELRAYWTASAKKKDGRRITWDEWFHDKPDFIFGF